MASTQDSTVARTLAITETMVGGDLGQTGTMVHVVETTRNVSVAAPDTRKSGHLVRVQDIADGAKPIRPDDVNGQIDFLYIRASDPFTLGFTQDASAKTMKCGKEVFLDNVGGTALTVLTITALADDTEFRIFWMV